MLDTPIYNHQEKISRPAIIDIGSNSVRLVIYENFSPAVNIFYNEKFSCKLGCFTNQGTLSDKSKEKTIQAIQRFKKICDANHVTTITAIATAAMRDAHDGLEFSELLSAKTGITIKVISGDQEAYYAAMGVAHKIPYAIGTVGDLGGGSLELAIINQKTVGHQRISLPLGVLRIQNETQETFNLKTYAHYIDTVLDGAEFDNQNQKNFYCVGGSWRALMRCYIHIHDVPLHVLQGFKVSAQDVVIFLEKVIADKIEYDYKDFSPHISKRRFAMLPVAALLLLKLIKKFKFETLIVSIAGVREGAVVDSLPHSPDNYASSSVAFAFSESQMRARNPLLYPYFIRAIQQILPNLTPKFMIFVQIITYLSDVAFRRHSDYRAQYVFDFILYANLDDLTHTQRVLIASVIAWRYDPDFMIPKKFFLLLKNHDDYVHNGRTIALALRYLYSVTGISHLVAKDLELIRHSTFIEQKNLSHNDATLLPSGETTQKRFNALQKHLFS